MSDLIKIAVDAMGGDGSPKKIIDGLIHSHKKNKEIFFKIFGDKEKIEQLIGNNIKKDNFQIIHTSNRVKSTELSFGRCQKRKRYKHVACDREC